MTETKQSTAALPRLIASLGAYRALVDSYGFQLEVAKSGGINAGQQTITSDFTIADVVATYHKEPGCLSADLMALGIPCAALGAAAVCTDEAIQ